SAVPRTDRALLAPGGRTKMTGGEAMKWEDVSEDSPRLAVFFKSEGGKQEWAWGMGGRMPMFDLVGALVRVQRYLSEGYGWNKIASRDAPDDCVPSDKH